MFACYEMWDNLSVRRLTALPVVVYAVYKSLGDTWNKVRGATLTTTKGQRSLDPFLVASEYYGMIGPAKAHRRDFGQVLDWVNRELGDSPADLHKPTKRERELPQCKTPGPIRKPEIPSSRFDGDFGISVMHSDLPTWSEVLYR